MLRCATCFERSETAPPWLASWARGCVSAPRGWARGCGEVSDRASDASTSVKGAAERELARLGMLVMLEDAYDSVRAAAVDAMIDAGVDRLVKHADEIVQRLAHSKAPVRMAALGVLHHLPPYSRLEPSAAQAAARASQKAAATARRRPP